MKSFITKKINRLINKNYRLAKARKYQQYCQQHSDFKNPLILYQMGKVGSSTLVKSLQDTDTPLDIFQVHFLTNHWIDKVDAQYKHASKIRKRFVLDEHWLASKYLNQKIAKNKNTKWKVITLVRDPVARNVSTFFQAFDVYFAEEAKKFRTNYLHANNSNLDELADELIDIYLNKFDQHDVPLNWYDTHMKPVFNIDVFESEFEISTKYQILNGKNIDLLILRLEDLNTTAPKAIEEFLGINDFSISNANISDDKSYAKAYTKFKQQIKLPETYIDTLYSSRFMTHFYSQTEIDNFRCKWTP